MKAFKTILTAGVLFLSANARCANPLPSTNWTISKTLGSTDLNQVMLNRITPRSGCHLAGVHIDDSRVPNRYYAFDSGNNRILGFFGWRGPLPDGQYPQTDIVIGQPSAWDHSASNGNNESFVAPTAATLALLPYPYVASTAESPRSATMCTDSNGNLYVPDLNNNRVLKYNDPFASDSIADDVWGQPGFTTRDRPTSPTASSLNLQWEYGTTVGIFGAGVHIDSGGNLWVTDSGNHRVLRFPKVANSISKTADLVIGQANFTSATPGTALNRLYKPQAVRVHPATGELYVLDGESPYYGGPCRLLAYKPPFLNGMPAVRELGKNASAQREIGLFYARGFAFDPTDQNAIWVADGGNDRILKLHAQTGSLLDVAGRTDFTLNQPSGYVDWQGSVRECRQPDGGIAFDRRGNLHFTCPYGTSGIVRVPVPLRRDSSGRVLSDSQMLAAGWNSRSGRTVQDQYGMALSGNQLFVRDGYRVLVWNNASAAGSFSEADLVIGQDSLEANEPGGTFLGQQPARLHAAGSYLFASSDDRVFIFSTPVKTGGRDLPPVKIIQSNTSGIVWADDGQPVPFLCNGLVFDPVQDVLWISDYQRNRILRVADPLSAAPKVNLVIGQSSKAGSADNQGLGLFSTNSSGIAAPWALALDRLGNLYAVDSGFEGREDNSGNRRVLRFDAASIRPVAGNIFPNPSASGVFCKPNLTANRNINEENRPQTPVHIAFNSANQMILLCDSYGNRQGERVWFYPTPHIGVAPQPTHIIPVTVGQAAIACFDDSERLILQDHTWNRILFLGPASSSPAIRISESPPVVPSGTPGISLSGACNSNVSGMLKWSTSDGNSGERPSSPNWLIPFIPIGNSPVTIVTVSGASVSGYVASAATSVATRILNPPAISPESGSYVAPLTISAAHFRADVTIRYTLDGSEPTSLSPILTGGLTLGRSSTFKTRAFAPSMPPSATAEAKFILTAPTASISPIGGSFSGVQDVLLQTSLAESIIRYTLDGSEPTESSPIFGGSLTLDSSVTLKARVFRRGILPGPVVSATFVRLGVQVSAPTILPGGGSFHGAMNVTLSSVTPGSLIRFTLDGQDVSASAPIYAGPIVVSRTTIVKARAEAPGYSPSPSKTETFHMRSSWSAFPLPAGQTSPDLHVALGSDGSFVYFTKGLIGSSPFFRMPKQGGGWQSLAPLPIPHQGGGGGVGDMAHLNGGLFTFAVRDAGFPHRALFRYDIGTNKWSRSGPMENHGVNTACVPVSETRILGGWSGWTRIKEVRDQVTGAAFDRYDLSGGAAGPWDGCAGADASWFIKHSWEASSSGVLARIPHDGSAVPEELPGLPFNPGVGCAIEAVPGRWFSDGCERIFVLRGGSGSATGDGNSWIEDTQVSQLAVYSPSSRKWSIENLPFSVGEGSEMALVDGTLFILASRSVTVNPLRSFRFTDPILPTGPRDTGSNFVNASTIRFSWSGQSGRSYGIEASDDLINWSLRAVLTAGPGGGLFFDSVPSSGPRHVFYRLFP